MAKKRKRYFAKDHHHIVPTSRGGGNGENVVITNKGKHNDYHKVFENKTPDEIIDYLVNHFWGGNWDWLDLAREKFERRLRNENVS